jgi:drug/metabolite transporter (DMT)-like permease
MSNVIRGIAPLFGYAVFVAASDVYAGNRLQSLSPMTIAAVSFTLAAIFFLGLDIGRNGLARALRPLRTHRRDVVAINVITAWAWLTLLFALKYLEPAVLNVIAFAIGPALTVLLGPLLRRGTTALTAERAVAAFILGLIGLLSWESLSGMSAVGKISTGHAVLGIVLAVACGLACTGNVIYSKRLIDAGLTPLSSSAIRYFVTIIVSWTIVIATKSGGLGSSILPGAIVALLGLTLPTYLGQIGIRYVEPITAALLETLSPVCAFLLQFFDARLQASGITFAGIAGITCLVGLGVLARHRHETRLKQPRREPIPAPEPVDAGAGAGVAGSTS